VRDARRLTVAVAQEVEAELPALISTDNVGGFRSVRQRAVIEGDVVTLNAETADALRVRAGDTVRVKT
jgi:arginine N-succinyltransferase